MVDHYIIFIYIVYRASGVNIVILVLTLCEIVYFYIRK